MTEMLKIGEQDILVNTGRLHTGQTYVRMTHLPTGKHVERAGLGTTPLGVVYKELAQELLTLLGQEDATEHKDK